MISVIFSDTYGGFATLLVENISLDRLSNAVDTFLAVRGDDAQEDLASTAVMMLKRQLKTFGFSAQSAHGSKTSSTYIKVSLPTAEVTTNAVERMDTEFISVDELGGQDEPSQERPFADQGRGEIHNLEDPEWSVQHRDEVAGENYQEQHSRLS